MPSLRTLAPLFRPQAESFVRWAQKWNTGVRVTSARRTRLEQMRLWQAAQRGENDGLPVATPGTSDHEHGLAFDLARPGTDPFRDPVLAWLGSEWRAVGGRWSERDPVHFAAPARITRTGPVARPARPRTRRKRGA